MNQLYRAVGLSKQAVHQQEHRQLKWDQKIQHLVAEAELLRAEHPGCGVEKMYYTLAPDFLGRDRFIDQFMNLGFRLKRSRNYRRTTYAGLISYPNLIKGMEVNRPSRVWQSDLTYVQIGQSLLLCGIYH
jgi:putative transposase